MSPAMALEVQTEQTYEKGVKHLCDSGITSVPRKYILPVPDRPNSGIPKSMTAKQNLKLPIIDFAELVGPNRQQVLKTLSNACETYGFFQLVNHGIGSDVVESMIEVSSRFFELPYEERSKYMLSDITAPVRYGTSFNQTKDNVFCWRDFLKLQSHPLPDSLPYWPSSPSDFRELAANYSRETKSLFQTVVKAIIESLDEFADNKTDKTQEDDEIMKQLEDGSHLIVVNCYPPCPEPELTLGMPPHSDYGFLTLLLQDEVQGLQIQFQDDWVTVDPIPGSFVVNVGDHLEIFSNGLYKSVLHRVLVNSWKPRISVASLHSLPYQSVVKPSSKLVNQENPKRYMDTDFATFVEYIKSFDSKKKNFLESRKIDPSSKPTLF